MVGVAQADAFGPPPKPQRRIDVAGNKFSDLETGHGTILGDR
jgi:hypothetical protein